jgi:hypothetical protein
LNIEWQDKKNKKEVLLMSKDNNMKDMKDMDEKKRQEIALFRYGLLVWNTYGRWLPKDMMCPIGVGRCTKLKPLEVG